MAQRDEVNSWFYIRLTSELDCYPGLLISAYHLTRSCSHSSVWMEPAYYMGESQSLSSQQDWKSASIGHLVNRVNLEWRAYSWIPGIVWWRVVEVLLRPWMCFIFGLFPATLLTESLLFFLKELRKSKLRVNKGKSKKDTWQGEEGRSWREIESWEIEGNSHVTLLDWESINCSWWRPLPATWWPVSALFPFPSYADKHHA